MVKLLKKRLNSRSRSKPFEHVSNRTAARILNAAAVFFFTFSIFAALAPEAHAAAKKAANKAVNRSSDAISQTETYKDLIEKAQNLSLQKDRLQASQILLRAIARESRGSTAYKELTRALDELMTMFYTERAQSVFVAAESNLPLKPRDAIDGFTDALKLEDGNVTILKSIARAHLILGECDKAETSVKQTEALDPYASEVQLLRIQVLDCAKSWALMGEKIFPVDSALVGLEPFVRGLQIKDLLRRSETKRAKALDAQWEAASPDDPEVYYWKWMISKDDETAKPDRVAAQKYVQLCQNLSPRKRKSYNLDVDLCKGKEAVDTFLKEPAHDD